MNHPDFQKIITTVLLLMEKGTFITPSVIDEKVSEVLRFQPDWGKNIDIGEVKRELIRRLSVWIGKESVLKNDEDHVQWLNQQRKDGWKYWQRYREYLDEKLPFSVVDSVDTSTDQILGYLEDPVREGSWDRRGLVVGYVQSGKTSNYIGLICKAADAGYKIIVVLAGLHNNLRAQTQMRLDEGFLGYETNPDLEKSGSKTIGVGLIDNDIEIRPNYATNRSEKGDFNSAIARNLGVSPEQRPWLFVVKKNKTVLKKLLRWIHDHVAIHDYNSDRKIVDRLPLLLIDDESDNASVDTGNQVFDGDGIPDDEYQPKAINSLIRQILFSFSKSAYVGYTATPFANIFIHEQGETKKEGPDLFPSGFIINLPSPSNYIGPSTLFGTAAANGRSEGLPLIREIIDTPSVDGEDGWMPRRHKSYHIPLYDGANTLPPSLEDAVNSFLICCALRMLRNQGDEHSSMLIHVTRYTAVQQVVYRQVKEYISHIRQRLIRSIDVEQILTTFKVLWEEDFSQISNDPIFLKYGNFEYQIVEWEQVLEALISIIPDIHIRVVNGSVKDILDYSEYKTGLKVIAIGGDKLSRGLTLEGLCTSYFLRASSMYDTLMQMGRWFGYRPNYLDLCRLYITPELMEWFCYISDASDELREEFDLMVEKGGTPRDYGLKVKTHPDLLITSRLKMRNTKDIWLSFSGELIQTIVFHRNDLTMIKANLDVTERLMDKMGSPVEVNPSRVGDRGRQQWTGYLWRDVSAENVIDFMDEYSTHPASYKVRSDMIAEFIQKMNQCDELTKWTVAILGASGGDKRNSYTFKNHLKLDLINRKGIRNQYNDRYSIGILTSPRDESIDLNDKEWKAALELTHRMWKLKQSEHENENNSPPKEPSGLAIREVRGFGYGGANASRKKGLLILYALSAEGAELDYPKSTPPIIGFSVSFPASNSGEKVRYKVSHVEWRNWEREYGAGD